MLFSLFINKKHDLNIKTKPTLKKIKDGKKIAMKKKNYH